ncbi:TetR/AcrR family transcriptional regulator [Halomicrobium sp. IBSBa]|uniref:TetR/AcrR family transcriptional regulator n=1 Tax=Halomicrobium sp. IBSBa TaxID=2778916 RepID=UPI001ABFF625|nr:TetR/AcrR family transcriptional regulator [Halomicrobium sp. IBSBa]MBO4247598.1 TetR/AcrR family transcriptional regulator [Halomicrobium sp. IBSBa]
MTTDDDIMEATFAALCKHGYADLTMQSIADEFEKSKSLLHYHYDSKEDLIVSFMEHLLENFLREFDEDSEADPMEQLLRMTEIVVEGDDSEGPDDVHMALLGLRAQAPYDEALRAQQVHNDRHIRDLIADIVREGIEQGQFRDDVDPERFAAVFRSAIEGAQSHDVILGEDAPTETALAGIEEYLLERLLVEGESLVDDEMAASDD